MSAQKIVVVTGANKGIGYETVKALLASPTPYHVFLGSRSRERGESAVATLREECAASPNTVESLQIDVTSDASIEAAVETVRGGRGWVDVLINNAGMWMRLFFQLSLWSRSALPLLSLFSLPLGRNSALTPTPGITKDLDYLRGKCSLRESLTGSYDVNVAGAHVTTSSFMPLLLQSRDPRLVFIAGLGTFAQCARGQFPLPASLARGWPKNMDFETVGYRCSKTALNMLMLDYHFKLRGDGVKVWCAGPGFLATDLGDAKEMVEGQGAGHPRVGGELVRTVVEGERDGEVGRYVVRDGVKEF